MGMSEVFPKVFRLLNLKRVFSHVGADISEANAWQRISWYCNLLRVQSRSGSRLAKGISG